MITDKKTPYRLVDEEQLEILKKRENESFRKRTPKSRELFGKAQQMLLNGTPTPWMGDWGTEYPIFSDAAVGNRLYDIDGNAYIDFCLGDTGAMFGHSPGPTADSEYDMNPGVPKEALSRVVEFNDLDALERALAYGDCACAITEPVMTNCGMVLPDKNYLETLRELCTKYGTYLVIDETHTFSFGYGGYTRAFGLKPDFLTLGKSIAGGIPVAVYGFTSEIGDAINASFGRKGVSDPMGIGGTLSGNAFAIKAMLETLRNVATPEAFAHMIAKQERLSDGLEEILKRNETPWSLTRSGARCELQFMPKSPKNGAEAKAHFDWELMYYMHIFLSNRGLLITPFHNMMLVPPVATDEDIDALINGWDACITELAERRRKSPVSAG